MVLDAADGSGQKVDSVEVSPWYLDLLATADQSIQRATRGRTEPKLDAAGREATWEQLGGNRMSPAVQPRTVGLILGARRGQIPRQGNGSAQGCHQGRTGWADLEGEGSRLKGPQLGQDSTLLKLNRSKILFATVHLSGSLNLCRKGELNRIVLGARDFLDSDDSPLASLLPL